MHRKLGNRERSFLSDSEVNLEEYTKVKSETVISAPARYSQASMKVNAIWWWTQGQPFKLRPGSEKAMEKWRTLHSGLLIHFTLLSITQITFLRCAKR